MMGVERFLMFDCGVCGYGKDLRVRFVAIVVVAHFMF